MQPSNTNSNSYCGWLKPLFRGRIGFLIAIFFAALSIAFAGYRAHARYASPGPTFDFDRSGMSDFHNGAYFPSMAFRDGNNPYAKEVCDLYPMARSAPPYSPVVFLLHQPFTFLKLPAADIAYFAFSSFLIGGLAWFSVSSVRQITGPQDSCVLNWIGNDSLAMVWAFTAIMFSRPGHITLFTGYFNVLLVIGTMLALHFGKSKPWLAGVGMLLASGKPTYILPLIVLMFARRNFKSLIVGLALCAIVAGGGLAYLASYSDIGTVVTGIAEGQEAFDDDPTEFPVNTWTRLDAMGVVSKVAALKPSGKAYLAGMLLMLIPIGLAIWRRSDDEANQTSFGLTGLIACLAILITIYHHSYDALLIAPAWLALILAGKFVCPELGPWQRWTVIALLTVPLANYVATLRFRGLLQLDNQSVAWNVITSANGACLLLALVLLLVTAVMRPR